MSTALGLRSLAVACGAFALVVGSVAALRLAGRGGVTKAHAGPNEGEEPLSMHVSQQDKPAGAAVAPPFAGLDLTRIAFDGTEAVAPLAGKRMAHLTIDARLQKIAVATLKQHKLPEASIVMMDPDTGAILAYASRSEQSRGAARDLA